MYPSAFDYHKPSSVAEAVSLLQQNPEGKLLAGGHSLLPVMKLRLASPAALIDLGGIADLVGVRSSGGRIVIGAMTTYYDLLHTDVVQQSLPVVTEASEVIGDLQVRNRGTIGGSAAHADPAADMPAVLLALDAELKVVGPNGERTLSASDFFVDMFTTALEPEEIVTEILIPEPQGKTGMAYEKFAHPASGYAIVGAAAVVKLGNDGKAESVRVAVTGSVPIAVRCSATEDALTGQELTDEAIKAAAQQSTQGMTFLGDIHASEEYREHLTKVFVERALKRAAASARS